MRTVNEKKNSLLKRNEIIVSANYDSNPGFAKVQEDIAKKFDASDELVVVKRIHGGFGTREFKVNAFIYSSTKDKEIVEPKKKEKKVAGEAAPVPAGVKK